jgi:hypothetical protein
LSGRFLDASRPSIIIIIIITITTPKARHLIFRVELLFLIFGEKSRELFRDTQTDEGWEFRGNFILFYSFKKTFEITIKKMKEEVWPKNLEGMKSK